jgi:predicted acetyltransferase
MNNQIIFMIMIFSLSGSVVATDSDAHFANDISDIMLENFSLKQVTEENIVILFNLGQAYEAEFSKITGKLPNEMGIFQLDTKPIAPYTGYIFYEEKVPVGFCIINTRVSPMDIAEFYIIPSKRKQKLGMFFSWAIFKKYPGIWQVRQIQGADYAVSFWRSVIAQYTLGDYKDELVEDQDWGMVTRQTFSSKK